ncbi:hypothetical protein CHLNCDRAFT_137767 [Chlorella variabilis]|uniref:CBS domain-containing protein n=1 Tax=Chlorella variabilis TaxID=554065 RepID=E1Z4G2_CHLVA|nr:hypothetical protein CHLNCDRAFT_137767 [Chlorella variabilis]EFN59340.1 hypothetical protein CHLNCDRAFT_137767 [Chlorella variabilis]|eukprot:XP_005851442.1 hypothetical protein CHLNCDRAFT_137767 [Chlorella variabilis]
MDTLLQPARDLLAGVTLRDYLSTRPPRAVTSVATTDQLGAVLRRFAAGGLVAAPLFADEARTAYLGFIDLLDVVAAVVEAARLSAGSSGSGHELRQRAAATANALASQPVGTIRAATNDAQVVYLSQLGSSLLEVVREGFAAPVDNLACHRLAVFQPSGGSMSSGSSRSSSSPELAAMDADGSGSSSLQLTHIVGFREKAVMCVSADMAVFDALAGMVDNKVPAVAVIDSEESGVLIGNISISELRGILPEHFEQLVEPVGEFLGGGWRGSPHWQPRSQGGIAQAFGIRSPEQLPHTPSLASCTLDSRFGEVLDLLASLHLHRLFVVDSEGRPSGVVSLTDLLRLIAGDSE